MIYGNVVRQYANDKHGYVDKPSIATISESDAILEALQSEYDNYSNIVMNESYIMNDREKIVLEAKMQAIHEALGAAIVAAIIAAVGDIIAIIAAIIKILSKGTEVMDKAKSKKAAEIGKSLSTEKKKEIVEKIEGTATEEKNELATTFNGVVPYVPSDIFNVEPIERLTKVMNLAKENPGMSLHEVVRQTGVDFINEETGKIDAHKFFDKLFFGKISVENSEDIKKKIYEYAIHKGHPTEEYLALTDKGYDEIIVAKNSMEKTEKQYNRELNQWKKSNARHREEDADVEYNVDTGNGKEGAENFGFTACLKITKSAANGVNEALRAYQDVARVAVSKNHKAVASLVGNSNN